MRASRLGRLVCEPDPAGVVAEWCERMDLPVHERLSAAAIGRPST